jgi:hypothetical protein
VFWCLSSYFLPMKNAQNCTVFYFPSPLWFFFSVFRMSNCSVPHTKPSLHVSQACLDSVCKATIFQARRVEAGDVSAAGGLLSLSSSVGGTGVPSSTVSMSSESAFVPDASGAVTVRSGVPLQGHSRSHNRSTGRPVGFAVIHSLNCLLGSSPDPWTDRAGVKPSGQRSTAQRICSKHDRPLDEDGEEDLERPVHRQRTSKKTLQQSSGRPLPGDERGRCKPVDDIVRDEDQCGDAQVSRRHEPAT